MNRLLRCAATLGTMELDAVHAGRSPSPCSARARWARACAAILAAAAAAAAAPLPTPAPDGTGAEPRDAEPASPDRPFSDKVVVTATREQRPVERLPVSATVVARDEIEATPAVTVEDLLRTVPGVLLPSGSSAVMYPTRNTLSMRGLGGHRALVLFDGIPINDPMLGHVPWEMVPLASIDRIEVVRGGAASLFGSAAMGGTVNVVTSPVADGELSADVSGGTFDTWRGTVAYGRRVAPGLALGLAVEAGQSDGYQRVLEADRTAIDTTSPWERVNATLRADLQLSAATVAFVRVGGHSYDLSSGTPYSATERDGTSVSVGMTRGSGAGHVLELRAFHQAGDLVTDNVAILAGGASGYTNNRAATPSASTGGSAQWSGSLPESPLRLTVGFDLRRLSADEHRTDLDRQGDVTSTRDAGGEQDSAGVFAQASWPVTERAEVLASIRFDYWRNHAGYERSSHAPRAHYPARDVTQVNPRLSARYDLGRGVAVRAGAYRAFGAPTLRELYRSSSLRGQENLPNPDLGPETLLGGEIGLDIAIPRLRAQLNLYENRIDGVIGPVLLSSEPVLTFQPQNVGTARSRGLELMGEVFIDDAWRLNAAVALTDAETVDSPEDPSLEGKRLPEVPRRWAACGLSVRSRGGAVGSLRVVHTGGMFYDPANTLAFDSRTVLDLLASWPLGHGATGYVALTNLLGEVYAETVTPTFRRGAPRELRLGVRFRGVVPRAGGEGAP